MKQIIYILFFGLFACNGQTKKSHETELVDSLSDQTIKTIVTDTMKVENVPVFSLSYINEELPFDNWLSKLNDIDSIREFQIEVDSIKRNLIKENELKDSFSLKYTWTLSFYEYFGWEDHFAGQGTVDSINQKYVGKYKTAILTSEEIFHVFKISGNSNFPLDKLPVIYESDALFNGKWTAIYSSNDYLIIRRVVSYPYGNQTSWYKEKIYYFKKHD